jgi:alpha-ketoglutarate-dependent taurine dioxygenase
LLSDRLDPRPPEETSAIPARIEPLEGPIGALVHGLDTRRPLGAGGVATVEQTVFDHIAIVIPDLEENVPGLHDFGRRFGPLVPHVLDRYEPCPA